MNTDIAIQYVEREIRLARSKGAAYVFFDMTNETIREIVLYYHQGPILTSTKTFYLCLSSRHVSHYTSDRVVLDVLGSLISFGNPYIRSHLVCLMPLKKPIKHIKRINNEDR